MTFSVIIPTKNRPKELIKLFDSLILQTYPPDQIIIIDQSEVENVIKQKLIKKMMEDISVSKQRRDKVISAIKKIIEDNYDGETW